MRSRLARGRPSGWHARLAAALGLPLLVVAVMQAQAQAQAQAQPAVSPGPEACTPCHGPAGNSPSPAIPSIAGQPKVFIENQLVLMREGLRDVPAMKAVLAGLEDAAVVALARHFSAQAALAPAGSLQADAFRAGAAVSRQALCGTCHLPDYSGQNQVPRLAGQQQAYLADTMKMYRDNPAPGRDTAMSAALRGLTDAELGQLAHYFSRYLSQPATAASAPAAR